MYMVSLLHVYTCMGPVHLHGEWLTCQLLHVYLEHSTTGNVYIHTLYIHVHVYIIYVCLTQDDFGSV